MEDAKKIAQFLSDNYGCTVYGIGSLFSPDRSFSNRSDIDLVVKGLPKSKFFTATGQAVMLSRFNVDIIPYEDANELIKEQVDEEGVPL